MGLWDYLGIPDFRVNRDSLLPPSYTWKSNILGPKKETRDYLLNLYFSKPDYEEVHRKLYYSTYWGAKFAAMSGALEVASMKSRNPTIAMNIIAKNFIFIGGAAITYGTVAAAAANLRGKKDDIFNHAIAGASLGLIWGFQARSSGQGATFGLFCAIAGALLKQWHLSDRSMFKWITRREISFMDGCEGTDSRYVSHFYLNTHDTKERTVRYNL